MPDPREHPCEAPGCDRWGSFGFRVGGSIRWFCLEHKDIGERLLAAPDGGPGPAKPQGDLFGKGGSR
jgi:hypothetical protein